MTLEQLEQAKADIENLADELKEVATRECANKLRGKCQYYSFHMRGGFDDVAEELGTVSLAASKFTNAYVNLSEARGNLDRAVAAIGYAVVGHRQKHQLPQRSSGRDDAPYRRSRRAVHR